jgi:hypothetical protein
MSGISGGVVTRTIACVGKKLGWEKGFGVDMRCYDACRFEVWGALRPLLTTTAGTTVTRIGDDG